MVARYLKMAARRDAKPQLGTNSGSAYVYPVFVNSLATAVGQIPVVTEVLPEPTVIQRLTYTIAGQAVAMRVTDDLDNNDIYFLYNDHLGSTSALSDVSGNLVPDSTAYYLPFGSYRTAPGTNPEITDRGFTGHKHNDDLGLIYMNARYYVGSIGRFASADSVVPNPTNPQSFNRYSYVLNSPIGLKDPTGHRECGMSCPGDPTTWQINFGSSWYGSYDTAQQKENRETAEQIGGYFIDASGFIPGVGEAQDIFDIGNAIVDGELNRALLIGILTLAPGRASAVLDLGADGLRRLGLSDDIAEGIIRVTSDCFGNSFSAGTIVMTEDGSKPIEEIDVGDIVLAYNEVTGEIEYHPVTDLISHIDMQVVYLTIEGEIVVTTADHPFYTTENEWLEAGDLEIGDDIRTASWMTGEVKAIYFVTQPQRMYNFTVATAHTYFVGDSQWLVHNENCGHVDPQILRGRGGIGARVHIDPANVGLDGISTYCRQCIDSSTRKWWGRNESEIRAFAVDLGLDPDQAVVYTPQFGGEGHYSLFIDAIGPDGKILSQYADAIDAFLRSGEKVP